jgi:hypothetical protein
MHNSFAIENKPWMQYQDYSLSEVDQNPAYPKHLPEQDISLGENKIDDWINPVVLRLFELAQLPENWDSYGAKPVSQQAIYAMLDLLLDIMKSDTPTPSIVPTVNGKLQAEWHIRDIDLEVEVISPTLINVFFEDHQLEEEQELELSVNLQPLAEYINRLSART